MNPSLNTLREQYGCGPVQFSGTNDALYERHLIFDRIIDPTRALPRDQWDAAAHAVRDFISQRWLKTDETYELTNPKRVYYISMEFLLGRSLANNVTNALLSPLLLEASRTKGRGLADADRGGARCGSRQRRAWTASGLLHRLDGDHADTRHRLWAALRVRHFQADLQGWLAARATRQLVALARPMGSGAPAGNGRSEAQLLVRAAGRRAQAGIRTPLEPARHSIRPAGDRLRRQDHQHAQALGRRHAGLFRFPAIQSRRIRRRSRGDTRGRIAHASSLSRRFHLDGPGVALPAGIFPRRVLARRPGAPFPAYATATGAPCRRRSRFR